MYSIALIPPSARSPGASKPNHCSRPKTKSQEDCTLSSNAAMLTTTSTVITRNSLRPQQLRLAPSRIQRVHDMPLRLSSLHQRAFHREPYPESSPPSPISPQGKNAQPLLSPLPAPPRPSHAEPLWITLYFIFNLGLTLYNKVVLSRFPFPYTLTALHALLGTIGCFILVQHGVFQPAILNSKETAVLVAFSFLYTVNIAISNLSLQLVTVAVRLFLSIASILLMSPQQFHQIVRASTPIFTLILWSFLYGNHSSREKIVSLVPVVVGVGLSCVSLYLSTRQRLTSAQHLWRL